MMSMSQKLRISLTSTLFLLLPGIALAEPAGLGNELEVLLIQGAFFFLSTFSFPILSAVLLALALNPHSDEKPKQKPYSPGFKIFIWISYIVTWILALNDILFFMTWLRFLGLIKEPMIIAGFSLVIINQILFSYVLYQRRDRLKSK